MKTKIKLLSFLAINIALFVVLDLYVSINTGAMKFTVSAFPILIASLMFGPLYGFIVGICGAFVAQMFSFGFTPTTFLWILPAAFRGFYVGLFHKKFDLNKNFILCIVIMVSSSIIVTCFNTIALYVDSKMFGYYSDKLIYGNLIYRFLSGSITGAVYGLVVPLITKALKASKIF